MIVHKSGSVVLWVVLFWWFIGNATGIIPDVFTNPKELGYRIHSQDATSAELYLIQPKLWGSLMAQLGPYTSGHLFKMASVNVYLNTHVVQMYRTYTTPLYALCSVDNLELVMRPNVIILCNFHVTIPSISSEVFGNSSCYIQFNESECAAFINLDFLRLQISSRSLSQLVIFISQNITAYKIDQSVDFIKYAEQPDITASLITLSRRHLPVSVWIQQDFTWHLFLKDTQGTPLVYVGIPNFRETRVFPIRLGVDRNAVLQEFKFKLLLGPNLRYYYPKPAPTRSWRVQANSQPYGALIRARKLSNDRYTEGEEEDSVSDLLVISELVLEEINIGDDPSSPHPSGHVDGLVDDRRADADLTDSDEWIPDLTDSGDHRPRSGQLPIRLELISPGNWTHANSAEDRESRTLSLPAPARIPKPDALHLFVQFEPRDILEPPWFPAIPSPDPYTLRVLSLNPSVQTHQPANPLLASLFGPKTAGHLTDITNHVFCRPITARAFSAVASGAADSSTTGTPVICPTAMPRAPPEVEEALPHMDSGSAHLSDQFILALPSSAGPAGGTSAASGMLLGPPSVVPTHYGTVHSSTRGAETTWVWRDVRGPTVRRWMLEEIRIHVDNAQLRPIRGWKIAASSVYDKQFEIPATGRGLNNDSSGIIDRFEQTAITVTARIYMMRPGTGQRVYLGSSLQTEPVQFDITRHLPTWALVVRPVRTPTDDARTVSPIPAAYIHRDAFTERPYLVGRWPGRVMLGLVATSGDSQPLAKVYVNVGTSGETKTAAGTLSVTSVRAECVDPALRLSGQLTPALMTSGEEDANEWEKLYDIARRSEHDSSTSSWWSRWKLLTDATLPHPQRLKVDLHRIAAGPTDSTLITAAASSATRSSENLRSLYYNSKNNPDSSKSRFSPGHPGRAALSSSAATCPVHLLSVSLFLSDGTVIPTHTIPPGQLRLASFESDVVWDPALPIDVSNPSSSRDVEDQSTASKSPPSPRLGMTSERVRINSLVVWCPRLKTTRGLLAQDAAPLGAMDDVILAVQAGRALQDPGPPRSPTQLVVRVPVPGQAGAKKTSNHTLDPHSISPSEQSNAFISAAQLTYLPLDERNGRPPMLVTPILIALGCLAVLLLTINGIVLFAMRNRRRANASNAHGSTDGGKCVSMCPSQAKPNGSNNGGGPAYTAAMHSPGSHMTIYTDDTSRLLSGMGPVHHPDVIPMGAGLSVSSMGSGNTGPMGSLKQSIMIDPTRTSSVPHGGMIPVHLAGISSYPHPDSPMGMPIPGGWPTPSSSAHAKSNQPTNGEPTAWVNRLSPTMHAQYVNTGAGYRSAMGSVGTAEGCSDEGVPSNFEMTAQSRLLHGAAGGGASSTTSGGSGGVHPQSQHHQQPNANRMVFKRSPTSGLSPGSLSGGSSSGELTECRLAKRPETVGLLDPSCSPDGYFPRRQGSSPGRYPGPVKHSVMQSLGDSGQGRFSPSGNPMSDSFSKSNQLDSGMNHSLAETRQNHPPTDSPCSGRSMSRNRLGSAHQASRNGGPLWDLPLPSLTSFTYNGQDRCTDDLDSSPVPMPPPALLLTNRMCLDSFTARGRAVLSTSPPTACRFPSPGDHQTNAYKRSDSFDMATKSHGPNTHDTASGHPPAHLRHMCRSDDRSAMVGDTMDLSDEVSSESRASSTWRKTTGGMRPPLDSGSRTVDSAPGSGFSYATPPTHF